MGSSHVRATSAPPSPTFQNSPSSDQTSGLELPTSRFSQSPPQAHLSSAMSKTQTFDQRSSSAALMVVSGSDQENTTKSMEDKSCLTENMDPCKKADDIPLDSVSPSARRNSVKIGQYQIPIVSSDTFMTATSNQTVPSTNRSSVQQNQNGRRRSNGAYILNGRNQTTNGFNPIGGAPHILQTSVHPHPNSSVAANFPSYLLSYPVPGGNSPLFHSPSHMIPSAHHYHQYQYGIGQPPGMIGNPSYPVFNPPRHPTSGPIPSVYQSGVGIGGSPYGEPTSYTPPTAIAPNISSSQYQSVEGRNSGASISDKGSAFVESQQRGFNTVANTSSHTTENGMSNLMSPPNTPNLPEAHGAHVAPRGPPRKPRQTGHAIWVGNLPPNTKIDDLKEHFSRGATNDIESLFLISKSNCAFVNYRTHEACGAAIVRFYDSRFQGARLVCRLRKNVPSAGDKLPGCVEVSQPPYLNLAPAPSRSITPAHDVPARPIFSSTTELPRFSDRYFIVKSLTRDDIQHSVQTGIWATQQHNEEPLNKAFKTTENVYLIFSANKTGEYFGYARMVSPISDDTSKSVSPLTPDPNSDLEIQDVGPKHIYTPATDWAPAGFIVDDSSRGTIFWEASHAQKLAGEDLNEANQITKALLPTLESLTISTGGNDLSSLEVSGEDSVSKEVPQTLSPQVSHANFEDIKSAGRPFKVEWKSTARVPFTLTRGLCNPWNSNKEVKIARDGTELETSLGRRVVSLFHYILPGIPSERALPGSVTTSLGGSHSGQYPYVSSQFDPYSQGHSHPYQVHPPQARYYMPYHY